MNRAAWREWPRRIPLAVRVALVLAPVILAAQVLTLRLVRDARPMVPVFTLPGPPPAHASAGADQPAALPPAASAGRFPPGPAFRAGAPAWPGTPMRRLTPEEVERLRTDAPLGAALPLRGGLRTIPPRPPWQALAAVFAVTALLVWGAAAWITRPLARLARAAESLGRDVDHPALADDGPPEVRRAAEAFNRMQDRLRRYLRGRTDALLAMSHDLKTPITRLQLRLELLPAEQRAGLESDLKLLQARVEHALSFMRGVHGDEALKTVVPESLVATVAERFIDDGGDVRWSGQAPGVRCRPTQLERALGNLIENALRYAGHAQIDIGHDRARVWICVADRGPGVEERLLPRLTEPFFRAESSRNRDSGGSGLGLAIVKDIVESQGGTLHLGNRSGGGFEARIELPRT